jgi:hypothetical protein
MPKQSKLYSMGEIAKLIASPDRPHDFFMTRVRVMKDYECIQPAEETQGGQARYSEQSAAFAAVCNGLLDMGLSHSKSLGSVHSGGATKSPFAAAWLSLMPSIVPLGAGSDGPATRDEIEKNARKFPARILRAMEGAKKGELWVLRIDLVRDELTGERRYLSAAYNMDKPEPSIIDRRKSEIPLGSFLLQLTPLLLPIVTERSGLN